MAKASKPLFVEEVAKRAKIGIEQARTLLNAYKNPFHNAPLRRVGVEVISEKGAFSLSAAKAVPNAKRPERGSTKKHRKGKVKPKAKARGSAKLRKKASAKVVKPEQVATPAVTSSGSAEPNGQAQ
jgi:hypothetical protein